MSSASPVKTLSPRTKLSDSGVCPGVSSTREHERAEAQAVALAEAQRLADDGAVAMHDRQRAGALAERAAAGHVIGVHVGLDGVHELQAVRARRARDRAPPARATGSMSAATFVSSSPTR